MHNSGLLLMLPYASSVILSEVEGSQGVWGITPIAHYKEENNL